MLDKHSKDPFAKDRDDRLKGEDALALSQERIRANYKDVVLLLQGGGALGAYQAGVLEMLEEAAIDINWVAGISIGAINSAIIAGNPPGERLEKLRGFWTRITGNVQWPFIPPGDDMRSAFNQMSSWAALTMGAPGFFTPRVPPPQFQMSGSREALSYYETRELRHTLEEFVDFDLLNNGSVRLSVGAVNVLSGNFIYFDTEDRFIGPDHIMASGALPPGFPPVEVEGELYWDGGLVSNTPLQHVFNNMPDVDTLMFQVDLFSASGPLPRTIQEVDEREKDIRFSSRTRLNSTVLSDFLKYRRMVGRLVSMLPAEFAGREDVQEIAAESKVPDLNLVHLIYRRKTYDAAYKDYEFSYNTMLDHWKAGYNVMRRTLRNPDWFLSCDPETGFQRHDVHADSQD
ncbi:MAG: DUF3734 domain-containing protein [Devosia sp.]